MNSCSLGVASFTLCLKYFTRSLLNSFIVHFLVYMLILLAYKVILLLLAAYFRANNNSLSTQACLALYVCTHEECRYVKVTSPPLCVWGDEARGSASRSRALRAFTSAARRARVVCDITRGDWNCHARDYTRPQNVKWVSLLVFLLYHFCHERTEAKTITTTGCASNVFENNFLGRNPKLFRK